MTRLRAILIFAFALLITAEPLLHPHPLTLQAHDGGAASTICAACAPGASLLADPPPAVAAPVLVVFRLPASGSEAPSRGIVLSLPSRAPPAA